MMNKFSKFLMVAIFATVSIGFFGCSDEDGDGIPDILDASMTAQIGADQWTAATRLTTKTAGKMILAGTTATGLSLVASGGENGVSGMDSGERLLIYLNGDTIGTYKLSAVSSGGSLQFDYSCYAVYYPNSAGSDTTNAGYHAVPMSLNPLQYALVEGEVVITSIDETTHAVNGTFKFNLFKDQEKIEVRNGVIENMKYLF